MDADLERELQRCVELLPDFKRLVRLLEDRRGGDQFEAVCEAANAIVWSSIEELYRTPRPANRLALARYANTFMPREAQLRIFRRLAKDPSRTVHRAVVTYIRENRIREVSIGDASESLDPAGWRDYRQNRSLSRHAQGTRVQQRRGVPVIPDIKTLRKVLWISSRKQLGWMVTATDRGNGPYVQFAIAKRDGSDRQICAPKPQLRVTQRRILDEILDRVAPHSAAHGFVPGRSTVTNATPHVGAKLLMKFDLRNFFPTIHWSRVLGLFTSLGYYAGDCRISCDDNSRSVAMVLARLCTYTPDPKDWYSCATPQGAPTSPAIANLVCRGLDARLTGLAHSFDGIYTRYADDLTFSFRDSQVDVGRFRWWVDQICHQEGFFVNQSKLRVIRATRRQMVTGIVVNDTLRIPREQRRRFRAILYNCRRHGIDSQRRDHPDLESYLRGFASYVKMVHPEEGSDLIEQVRSLLGEDESQS